MIFFLLGACREEQAIHLHQDPRGARQSVLQGRQGEEHRGRARILARHPHSGVPQRHVDLARFALGHETRFQTRPPLSSTCSRHIQLISNTLCHLVSLGDKTEAADTTEIDTGGRWNTAGRGQSSLASWRIVDGTRDNRIFYSK